MSSIKILSPLAACILIALFAAPVYAHDGVDHSTEAEAEAHVKADAGLPVRPLDLIKAKAREIKAAVPNAKIELRADTNVQVRTTGQAPERKGSEAETGGDFKSILRVHGGVIKNRFRLAVSQMNGLLMRIDSRLGKMAETGVDITVAGKAKTDAELAVDKAEADAQAVADFVANVPDGSDRATVKAELETKLRTANTSLKAAHEAVMKAVRALVSLAKVKVDANASVNGNVQ